MKSTYIKIILTCSLLIYFHLSVFGQDPGDPGEIYLLKSHFTDSAGKKNLEAFFMVGTKKKTDFPPSIVTPTFYKLNFNGKEKLFELNSSNLSVLKCSRKMTENDSTLMIEIKKFSNYEAVKHYFIIRYSIKGIDNEFSTLQFQASYSAKRNPETRRLIAPSIELK